MQAAAQSARSGKEAFTLIELLVVIAIMAALAALVFPTIKAVTRVRRIAAAKAELGQIQACIESYKAKLGFYPPDNRNPINHQLNEGVNQLYYELSGTVFTNGDTFIDKAKVAPSLTTIMIATFFGAGVRGFVNADRGNVEEGPVASRFLSGVRSAQIATVTLNNQNTKLIVVANILVCTVPGVDPNNPPLNQGSPPLNPWRYNSSSPTNNSGSYDLWTDIYAGGKVLRVSNWSSKPDVVP